MLRSLVLLVSVFGVFTGCARLENVGKAPAFTPLDGSAEAAAMQDPGALNVENRTGAQQASLWSGSRRSLLGDRRAERRGDILTVVIEIDDSAEISNSSGRSRNGAESMQVPQFLGLPQAAGALLPAGASLADAVSTNSSSSSSGSGSVSRNERLELKVAATVVEELPNGILRIQGTQEVRVNFELRELIVTGYVRPEDISRRNEITYDKLASARISYGGRGQITDVQQPRLGQQVSDIILPF